MSWVQLRVDDVKVAAQASLDNYDEQRVALLNELTEKELHRWFFKARNLAEAIRRAKCSGRWAAYRDRTDAFAERVRAILMACEMSSSHVIHLTVSDMRLIPLGHV